MTIETINAEIAAATSALSAVSIAVPIAMAAYTLFKGIWLSTNPGKTEADYLTYLQTASQSNIDDTATYLTAQGYTQQADGSWRKA